MLILVSGASQIPPAGAGEAGGGKEGGAGAGEEEGGVPGRAAPHEHCRSQRSPCPPGSQPLHGLYSLNARSGEREFRARRG